MSVADGGKDEPGALGKLSGVIGKRVNLRIVFDLTAQQGLDSSAAAGEAEADAEETIGG